MARTKRRKAAALALVAVGVAGLSIASAAQLNLNSASLGAGMTAVASCQEEPIDVGFANSYSTAAERYDATAVTLSNVQEACQGLSLKITLTDADGVVLGTELTGTVATAASGSYALSTPVSAEDVTGVAVVIYS